MKYLSLIALLTFSLALGFDNNLLAQTRIKITTLDFNIDSLHSEKPSFIENRIIKSHITYTVNTKKMRYESNGYTIEDFHCIKDGNSIIKEEHKTKTRKWKNNISIDEFQQFLNALNKNDDNLEKGNSWHTSHHYQNIFIEIIQNDDTTTYKKMNPFECNTPWLVNQGPQTVLNPAIDKIVFNLLPKKFPRRELMNLERSHK